MVKLSDLRMALFVPCPISFEDSVSFDGLHCRLCQTSQTAIEETRFLPYRRDQTQGCRGDNFLSSHVIDHVVGAVVAPADAVAVKFLPHQVALPGKIARMVRYSRWMLSSRRIHRGFSTSFPRTFLPPICLHLYYFRFVKLISTVGTDHSFQCYWPPRVATQAKDFHEDYQVQDQSAPYQGKHGEQADLGYDAFERGTACSLSWDP